MRVDCRYQESVKSKSYKAKTYSISSSFEDFLLTLYLSFRVVATMNNEAIDECERWKTQGKSLVSAIKKSLYATCQEPARSSRQQDWLTCN